MIQDFLIPFLVVALAELGDKTQITVFCLSSKTKKHLKLLAGVMLAFIITDGLAIALGGIITKMIPVSYIKIGSGIVFIIFGIVTLIRNRKEESKCELKNPFFSGFGMILISEMGDKTQITSGLFATQYNPVMVFISVISALTILSITAVYLGKLVVKKINERMISKIAGILFVVIGIFCFF